MDEKMTLYSFDGCPYCQVVRRRMNDLGLTYTVVTVPAERAKRTAVFKASGQYLVPTLVTDSVTLCDENEIIDYLEKKYGAPAPLAQPLAPSDPRAALAEVARHATADALTLAGMSVKARADGDLDLANVLESAAKSASQTGRWVSGRLHELGA